MKKIPCILCHQVEGKRVCQINDNSLICPVCCAKTRATNCSGCGYYIQAEKYNREKSLPQRSKPFIMAIEPEVDDQVNDALALAEKGKIGPAELTILSLVKRYPHNAMTHYGMGVVSLFRTVN